LGKVNKVYMYVIFTLRMTSRDPIIKISQ